MKLVIRAVGWAITLLSIVVIAYPATVVYSALQVAVGFDEEVQMNVVGGTISFSFPFHLNNGGFYDISDLNLTTQVRDDGGSTISTSSSFVPLIAGGSNATVTHNISVALDNMTLDQLSHLLFNDDVLNADISLKLKFGVIPIQITSNFTIEWGAPLSNLTIEEPSFAFHNLTHFRVTVPLSFENHSFLSIDGTIRLELMNELDQVGVGSAEIAAAPQSTYATDVEMLVSDPIGIQEAHIYLDTSFLNYGPVVIPIGQQ